jgi:hypothetical protein
MVKILLLLNPMLSLSLGEISIKYLVPATHTILKITNELGIDLDYFMVASENVGMGISVVLVIQGLYPH